MHGLTSLFSQRSDRWEWQETESGKGYVLRHQLSPEAAAAATRQAMLERMATDAQTYHEIAQLPDGQRRTRAAALPHLFPGGYLEQARLDLFGALSRAQLADLFRGAALPIDPGKLGGRQQGALDSGMRGIPPVAPQDRSQPALFVKWHSEVAGPILWIRNDQNTEWNVMGGGFWDSEWFATQGDGWRYKDTESRAFTFRMLRRDPAGEPARLGWLREAATVDGGQSGQRPHRRGYRRAEANHGRDLRPPAVDGIFAAGPA